MWQAFLVRMRDGWESQSRNWAAFAGKRRWQRIPMLLHLRAIKP
jgi:hypothetical protein